MIDEIFKEVNVNSERIKQAVIDSFIEKKENRIVEKTLQAIAEVNNLNSELRKINRPDIITYENAITKEGEKKSYSQERTKLINELSQKIKNIENKLTKAYESGDFSKLLG